jgi:hypothetical protein
MKILLQDAEHWSDMQHSLLSHFSWSIHASMKWSLNNSLGWSHWEMWSAETSSSGTHLWHISVVPSQQFHEQVEARTFTFLVLYRQHLLTNLETWEIRLNSEYTQNYGFVADACIQWTIHDINQHSEILLKGNSNLTFWNALGKTLKKRKHIMWVYTSRKKTEVGDVNLYSANIKQANDKKNLTPLIKHHWTACYIMEEVKKHSKHQLQWPFFLNTCK